MIKKPFAKDSKYALTKKNITLMAASGALVISMAAPSVLAAPDYSDPDRPIDESLGENPTGDQNEEYDPEDMIIIDLEELEDGSELPLAEIPPQIPVDDTPPSPPVVVAYVAGDAYITGEAEALATVTVTFADDTTASAVTNSVGVFSILIPEEIELKADAEFTLVATDSSGNESIPRTVKVLSEAIDDVEDSQVRVIVKYVDESGNELAPDLELKGIVGDVYEAINLPIDGYEVTGHDGETEGEMTKGTITVTYTYMALDLDLPYVLEPTVSEMVVGDTVISGAGEPGHMITVDFGGGATATGMVGADMLFSIDVPAGFTVNAGDEYSVTATDAEGNVSEPVTTIVFGDLTLNPDTEAPDAPTVNPIKVGDNAISGGAEVNANIIVEYPDGLFAYGKAYDPDADEFALVAEGDAGVFSIGIPADMELSEGDELRVTATDGSGNISDVTVVTVLAADAPDEPIVIVPDEPEVPEPVIPEDPVIPEPEIPVDEPVEPDAPEPTEPDDEIEIDPDTPVDNDNDLVTPPPVNDTETPDKQESDKESDEAAEKEGNKEEGNTERDEVAENESDKDAGVAPGVAGDKPGGDAAAVAGTNITKDGVDTIPEAGAETNWLMVAIGSLVSGVAAAALFMRRRASQVFGN